MFPTSFVEAEHIPAASILWASSRQGAGFQVQSWGVKTWLSISLGATAGNGDLIDDEICPAKKKMLFRTSWVPCTGQDCGHRAWPLMAVDAKMRWQGGAEGAS